MCDERRREEFIGESGRAQGRERRSKQHTARNAGLEGSQSTEYNERDQKTRLRVPCAPTAHRPRDVMCRLGSVVARSLELHCYSFTVVAVQRSLSPVVGKRSIIIVGCLDL